MSATSRPPARRTIARTLLLSLLGTVLVLSGLMAALALGLLAPSSTALPSSALAPIRTPSSGASGWAEGLAVAPVSAVHPYYLPPVRPQVVSASNCTQSPVVPACLYWKTYADDPTAGAPMGIADFGVSGYGHPSYYAYSTSQFWGTYAWHSNYLYNASMPSGPDNEFTVQLNVVLNFVAGAGSGKNYSYWIQDVAFPTNPFSTSGELEMGYENNIWNFSTTAGAGGYVDIPSTTLSGNGTVSGEEYYADGASGTGSGDDLTDSQFQLIVYSTVVSGKPVVHFCYFDPTMTSIVCYDTVTFKFVKTLVQDNNFLVSGHALNPIGLFDDAELTVGGPGGGQYTTDAGPTNAQMYLSYWNGHNLEPVPSAYNLGDDTAESVVSQNSLYSNNGYGNPLSDEQNGTSTKSALAMDYSKTMLGTLAAWDPSTTGKVAIGAQDWSYLYGWASLGVVPGTYPVWINETSPSATSNFMGMCTIAANTVLNVTAGTPCGTTSSNPSVTAPTTTSPSIDVGQSATFTTTASGGTGTYSSYAWTTSPTSGLSCTTPTTTGSTSCSGSAAGIYTISVTVTDSGSHTSSPATSAAFHVYPDPTVAPPSPSASTVATGSSLSFTSSLGRAGAGSDTYAWTTTPATGLGCSASTTLMLSCTPTTAGSYNATITVTDANGGTGKNTSSTVTVTSTSPPPSVTAPTASPASSIDVTQSVAFSTKASGGSGTYSTYTWKVSPTSGLSCTSSTTSASTSCTASAAGSYVVSVTVTDNTGSTSASASSSAYPVFPEPTVAKPNPSVTSLTVGGSVSFSTSLGLAGSGGDTYSWSESTTAAGCTPSTGVSYDCVPTAAGTFTATATVKDSNGGSGSNTSVSVTVNAPPPSVSVPTASPAAVDVGQVATFKTTPSGGSGSYTTFTWTSSPSTGLGCASSASDSWSCTPTSSGTYSVSVTVTDSDDHTSSAATLDTFVVSPDPSVSTPTASPASVEVGATISVSSTSLNVGSGDDQYAWTESSNSLGCVSADALSISCVPTASGSFTVTITATDSNEGTGSATSSSITVSSSSGGGSTPITVNPVATPNPGEVGQTITFSASVSGGSGSYTYSWRFDDGTGSTVASPTHSYSASGTYSVELFVNDTDGHSTSASVSLVINPSGGGSTTSSNSVFGSLSSDWFWVLLVVVVAVAIVAALALRRKPTPSDELATGAALGGAAYAGGYYGVGGAAPPMAPPVAPAPSPYPDSDAIPPPDSDAIPDPRAPSPATSPAPPVQRT